MQRDLERLAGLLVERGLTVATAESCTAGLVAYLVTSVPGSSRYFRGGVVAYANDVKQSALQVDADVLEKVGAVSEETAVAMALGVRRLLSADIGIGVTGIAGPDGGTPAKPVGLVYLAGAGPDVVCRQLVLAGDRDSIRWQAAEAACALLEELIINRR